MPVTSGDIRIRLSTAQRLDLKRRAELEGKNVSQYIRDRIFCDDEVLNLLREIHRSVCTQKSYK